MKTRILLSIMCLILITTLSGCFDFGLEGLDLGLGSYGYGYGGGNYEYTYEPTFYIDSASQLNDSTVKIWANIRYDSILTLKERVVSYIDKNGIEVRDTIQSQPEIIDFTKLTDIGYHWTGREEKIYYYSIDVTNLEKNFDCSICISHKYSYKEISNSNLHCWVVRLQ